ncbi:hypothetical protein AOLI_G00201880 [Acnodon oligacanthus]
MREETLTSQATVLEHQETVKKTRQGARQWNNTEEEVLHLFLPAAHAKAVPARLDPDQPLLSTAAKRGGEPRLSLILEAEVK